MAMLSAQFMCIRISPGGRRHYFLVMINVITALPSNLCVQLSMVVQFLTGPGPVFQICNPIHSRYDRLDGESAHRKAAAYT
jgi:hypothetical protein